MECKAISDRLCRIRDYVLIETLWNVKDGEYHHYYFTTNVLIETLWNVKKADPYKYSLADSVLIETLWNVKVS